MARLVAHHDGVAAPIQLVGDLPVARRVAVAARCDDGNHHPPAQS